MKKKIPMFFFGASHIISNRISNYFLVFDLKSSQSFLIYPLKKTCIYVTDHMSITTQISFKVTPNLTTKEE